MRKRSLYFAAAGCVVAAALLLGRQLLTHQALAAVLRNPAPTESALEAYVATSGDAAAALRQLWASQRIPQRRFVLNYLRSQRQDGALWQATRPLAAEALACADSEFQQSALQLFYEHQDAERQSRAGLLLHSPDSDVRLVALTRLNGNHDKQWAAEYARLLQDQNPQVRMLAAAGLRNLSGEDFGTRLTAATQMEGITLWKAWWQSHGADYPPLQPLEFPQESPPGLGVPIALPDMQGRVVRLADYRGKVVLLNFWATWCPSCAGELEMLAQLQRRHPDDLVILGINLDGVSDDDDHDAPPTPAQRAQTLATIQELLTKAGVTYPTLLDPAGSTLGPYGAGSLPTNVLIGAEGTIQRRMVGLRPAESWEELLAHAAR